jgi:crotonobetainyl-CoA:carnitine CoA-transferase CaiB-like acyl-CoA transferase
VPVRPLAGYRVVDLTCDRGELCGRLLSDLGAEVVKVEPPGGSPGRLVPPLDGDHSLFFTFRNCGKLSVELDLDRSDDLARFHDLLGCSDILIDSAEVGTRSANRLESDDVAERHPHLIVVSITAYGRTGPYAGRDVPNAVVDATSGMAYKAGVADREPLLPPGVVSDDTASVVGAFAAVAALHQHGRSGAGQVIDVSANESAAQTIDWSLPNASRTLSAGREPNEARAGPGPVYPIVPCRDGYVRLVVLSRRQWHAMRAWLGEPDHLQEPELDTFMGRFGIAEAVLNPLYGALFATMTMIEVAEEAQRRGVVCTPILTPADVITNAHFESRGTFHDVALSYGPTMKLPSGWFEIDGQRVTPTGRPPRPGEHTDDLYGRLGDRRPAPGAGSPPPSLPLTDLRVIDLGHGGVGVETGRMFAEYGADVIKIESRTYPDFIRVLLGGEMSPSFSSSSRSKRSLGLNIKRADGVDLLKRLARESDVVIENNSTGTMDRLGIGFADLSAENTDLVMMSSQLMGSHGLWADWSGYGPNNQVTGGMTHLWSYADGDGPAGSQSIFPDHFAGRMGALVALAGVVGRSRGGDGFHAEICQVEQVVGVLGDLLAQESLRPGSVMPRGNRSDRGSPWGMYRCAGADEWVAICCRTDEEWRALATMTGLDQLGEVSLADRRERADEIDESIGAWTTTLTKEEATEACLAAGVPAGPMLTAVGQTSDPHLEARGYLAPIDQPPIGALILEGPAFHATGMLGPDIRPAPGLGEHTRDISATLLGLSDTEIEELVAAGVLETDPPAGTG